MTYCVGILVEQGLVMIADTRTSAGIDNISNYRKLLTFVRPGECALALASAGNLSISQSVVSLLCEGMKNLETGAVETLETAPTMFRAAQELGFSPAARPRLKLYAPAPDKQADDVRNNPWAALQVIPGGKA